VTVKRYLRLIGDEHHGKVAPRWTWACEWPEVKLPIAPKPRIIVSGPDTPCEITEGPDHQVYARRTIPLTRGVMFEPVYFECWSLEGLPDGDVRGLLVEMLFEAA
jgi:hypothetical protein